MTEQKWNYEGTEFEPGDRVKIVKLPETKVGAMGKGLDWPNTWVDEMDGIIPLCNAGLVLEIVEIVIDGVIFATPFGMEGFYLTEYAYPLSVLEKVE